MGPATIYITKNGRDLTNRREALEALRDMFGDAEIDHHNGYGQWVVELDPRDYDTITQESGWVGGVGPYTFQTC